jgi:hypothetical protein
MEHKYRADYEGQQEKRPDGQKLLFCRRCHRKSRPQNEGEDDDEREQDECA